ncbi:MAG: AAA family ATPase [Raoultibacter sp.]
MKRKLIDTLIAWKNHEDRQPLLVYGARQVGKTYLVRDVFGAEHYETVCYVNFEYEHNRVAPLFDGDLDPKRIIADLEIAKNMSINPSKTLIIFDEIQLCENALTSLKYFAEFAPEYHIVATGSLFGVAVHRSGLTFPVGKVEVVHMFPMDFEEYLWAQGKERLAKAIHISFDANAPFPFHDDALRLYREYLLVGGMPKAVSRFLDSGSFDEARAVHRSLNDTYISDIARYIGDSNTARTLDLWQSVPYQLMKENKKFKFSDIDKTARSHQYIDAFAWLSAAGLIHKCGLTTDGQPPFLSAGDEGIFKVYLFDTGMLSASLNIEPRAIMLEDEMTGSLVSSNARGALAENYVMQSLKANGITPNYWRSKGSAEVDFLFQNTLMGAVPVEVKSGSNVRSKSLTVFQDKYDPAISIRISAKNFGLENSIKSVPLYAAFCIEPSISS